MRATLCSLAAVVFLAGCGGSGKSSHRSLAAAAGATPSSGPAAAAGPLAVNLLAPAASATPALTGGGPTAGASTPAGAATAGTTSAATPGAATPGAATPGAATPGAATPGASPTAASPTGAALLGIVPPDPTTGFDGSLYFVGERLAPGSVFLVTVNGVPTKYLPATFHSSELLSTYVYLTVPADYEFTAVAPDGTLSAPVRFTVPAGTPQALFGLNPPDVQMAFPTRLDTSFSGVVWLLGDQFMPGAVATIQQPGLPPLVAPLLVLNERTAGWVPGLLQAGSVTLTVTNPTLLSSAPVTFAVGPAPAAGAAPPSANFPGALASPFLGSVHVIGTGIALGAVVEHRLVGASAASTSVLLRISPSEAWWSLLYPAPGAYEARVVNPGGAASPWARFDVN